MQQITFVSRPVAQAMAARENWAVISIADPEEGPAQLQPGWADVLRLEFHDVDAAEGTYRVFDPEMARSVLDFGILHLEQGHSLLVHCHLGVSRSAAVAVVLGSLYQVPVLCGAIKLNPSYALYNRHVYRTLMNALHGYD